MNLAKVMAQTFREYPSKPAIIFEGRPYCFREVDEEVRKRALWLRKVGINKGDHVAIQLPKSLEFIFLHLAVLSVGAVSLPLNPAYSPSESSYFLADSRSSLFITEAHTFTPLQKPLEEVGEIRTVLVDEASPSGWGPLSWELEKVGSGDARNYPTQEDDVAMICYTSGTTGNPKGAMITHRNLVTNMMALKRVWAWTERDILLHVLPLFHIHGLVVALHGALYAGSTLIMQEKFDPQRAWEAIEEEKCTLLMAVPTIYFRLLKEWETVKPGLQTMKLFISGSAPLSESLFHNFHEVTGFRILERYGMTETGMITSNPLEADRRKPKSVGYPLPGVQIRLAVPGGHDVQEGEVGEVWIRGDNVFKGYWQGPEKTEGAFEGGWFKSGDLGYQDPKDALRLYLVGRAKEVIITGGYNVYPKEVINVLEQHEAIQEVEVIGLADEDFGEKVTAVVVFKKGHTPVPPKEIIAFCKKRLVNYKCPKQVLAVDQMPRNAMGKIQKDVLQKNCATFSSSGRKDVIPSKSAHWQNRKEISILVDPS